LASHHKLVEDSWHLNESASTRKISGPETIGLHRAGQLSGVLHGKSALPHKILPVQYDTQDS
jgi:hypothetical protein